MGEHSEEWFRERGRLVREVVDEMRAAGAYVFAGGLEERRDTAFTADPTGGTVVVREGPYDEGADVLGGFTVVDVPDDAAARAWAVKVAEACGWPQEVRRFGGSEG